MFPSSCEDNPTSELGLYVLAVMKAWALMQIGKTSAAPPILKRQELICRPNQCQEALSILFIIGLNLFSNRCAGGRRT